MKQIIKSSKILVSKYLVSLGEKVGAIIAGTSYALWDIPLPTEEDALALARTTLKSRDHICIYIT